MKLEFKDSYLGQLRTVVGQRPLIVPGFRIIIENDEGKLSPPPAPESKV